MSNDKRIVFLDYIRVFACFLVMLVHASENFYGAPGSTDMAGPQSFLANETDRLWVSLYDGFSRMSVPLFMIVSAFLLVPMKEGMSAVAFYKRRAVRILPAFLFFMIIYSTVPVLWNQIDLETSATDLARIPLNFPTLAGHLWFMYPLISLYLFIPFISPWLAKAKASEERLFIGLFFISTCMPYLTRFFGEIWGQCFWNEFHIRAKRLAVGSCLTVIGAVWTILSFYIQAVPGQLHVTPELEIGWSFCTINCVMLTTGAFLVFTCIRRTEAPRWISELSNLSYGMYLMHILWLGLFVGIFKGQMQLPTAVAIPVIALATFLSCAVSTKILSLIPFCRWMIGINRSPNKARQLSVLR